MDTEELARTVQGTMYTTPLQRRAPITAFIPSVGAPEMVSTTKPATSVGSYGVSSESFRHPYAAVSNNFSVANMPSFHAAAFSRSSGLYYPSFPGAALTGFSRSQHAPYNPSEQAFHPTRQVDSLPQSIAQAPTYDTLQYTGADFRYPPLGTGLLTPQVSRSVVNRTREFISLPPNHT